MREKIRFSFYFVSCLTIVQAARCARRAESHKHIQRSPYQSSSSPQLQYKVYFQTALEPEMQIQVKKMTWIVQIKDLVALCDALLTNQILECSNEGCADVALIQVFCISEINEFMDNLGKKREKILNKLIPKFSMATLSDTPAVHCYSIMPCCQNCNILSVSKFTLPSTSCRTMFSGFMSR